MSMFDAMRAWVTAVEKASNKAIKVRLMKNTKSTVLLTLPIDFDPYTWLMPTLNTGLEKRRNDGRRIIATCIAQDTVCFGILRVIASSLSTLKKLACRHRLWTFFATSSTCGRFDPYCLFKSQEIDGLKWPNSLPSASVLGEQCLVVIGDLTAFYVESLAQNMKAKVIGCLCGLI